MSQQPQSGGRTHIYSVEPFVPPPPPPTAEAETQKPVGTRSEAHSKKKVRKPPAGVDIPTLGLQRVQYGINKMLGRPDLVPHLSEKERRIVLRNRAVERLLQLLEMQTSLSVCFINTKGGGATTTTAAYVASVVADLTRSVLLGTDLNPANGTMAARLGRDYGTTIGLRELKHLIEVGGLEEFRKFIDKARPTRYGVRVISADSIIDGGQQLTGEDAHKMLSMIRQYAEYHFVDTPNNLIDPVALAVFEHTDVIVFTANVAVKDSLRRVATSMQSLRRSGFTHKVDNSVVVISNIPPGMDLQYYRKFLNVVDIEDREVSFIADQFRGQFVGIPHDPDVARESTVDLAALQWPAYQAYLQLGITILQAAPQFIENPSAAYPQ